MTIKTGKERGFSGKRGFPVMEMRKLISVICGKCDAPDARSCIMRRRTRMWCRVLELADEEI